MEFSKEAKDLTEKQKQRKVKLKALGKHEGFVVLIEELKVLNDNLRGQFFRHTGSAEEFAMAVKIQIGVEKTILHIEDLTRSEQ